MRYRGRHARAVEDGHGRGEIERTSSSAGLSRTALREPSAHGIPGQHVSRAIASCGSGSAAAPACMQSGALVACDCARTRNRCVGRARHMQLNLKPEGEMDAGPARDT